MSKKYIIKNGTAVEVSEELHDYLTKSDRKIRYIELIRGTNSLLHGTAQGQHRRGIR